MDAIWTVLGLEPTKDVSAIKRAYAEKAKTCHPEEDPEGFLQLRQAYQAALAWAENGRRPPAGRAGGIQSEGLSRREALVAKRGKTGALGRGAQTPSRSTRRRWPSGSSTRERRKDPKA